MLKIFLTDLQAYNEGHLVGRWLELPLTDFELQQALSEVLSEGEAVSGSEDHEEYFITDWYWQKHELFDVDEYHNIHQLNQQLQDLEFKSDHELQALSFLLQQQLAVDIEDALTKVDDVIIYSNYSMSDIAYDLMQECYQADKLPSIIANNIDYDGIAKELEYEGRYFEVGTDIYEYSN